MSTKKVRRGRPKGTGIDDRAELIRIAVLIAADPNLKPTTAIRKLGITEPSVIRRLRDKFKVFRQEHCIGSLNRMDGAEIPASLSLNDLPFRHDRSHFTQAIQKASRFTPRVGYTPHGPMVSAPR